jgi:hypothetical protein
MFEFTGRKRNRRGIKGSISSPMNTESTSQTTSNPHTLWRYFDAKTGRWIGPVTVQQLDELYDAFEIRDSTPVVSEYILSQRGNDSPQITYENILRYPFIFRPTIDEFFDKRRTSPVTVLCGPNNCGKSLILKQLYLRADEHAFLLAVGRFSHVDTLNTRPPEPERYRSMHWNHMQQSFTRGQNQDESPVKLEQIVGGLTDAELDQLLELCSDLIGEKFTIKHVEENRRLSPYYVDMNGQNLRVASTGTRVLMTVLGLAVDTRISSLYIDEPELGLSPRVQKALAYLLYSPESRAKNFPHIKQVIVATHSHLFLDRRALSNNFNVKKAADLLTMEQVTTVSAFHALQFRLLGNDLESLFLPSAIVFVEGDADIAFLSRVIALRFPDRSITVTPTGGEGNVSYRINALRDAFGSLEKSPYQSRLFVVFDSRFSTKKQKLVSMGIAPENVVVWSQNGIEYLYPPELVASVFACTVEEVTSIAFHVDPIAHNGIHISKKQLAQLVSERLTADCEHNAELEEFLARLTAASA